MNLQCFWKNVFFLAIALFLCVSMAEAARFVDNNDGTVSDSETGLMWQQTNDNNYVQWIQAEDYCDDLQSGGYNNWRLPDKDELFGIFDKTYYKQGETAIDPVFNLVGNNPNNSSYYAFWTNTEYPDSKFQPLQPKYIVIFGMFREDFLGLDNDIVSNDHKNEVLCVRDISLQVNNSGMHHSGTAEEAPAVVRIQAALEPTTSLGGNNTSGQIPVTVQTNQKPIASFTATKTSGQRPITVTLDASGSSDPDGAISNYSWVSSDGQNATGKTAVFTFESGGNVTITLIVTDNKGATDTALQLLATDIPNREPTASFTANPASGTASLEVMLDASGSFDPDGTIIGYSWSSSDGKKATGQKTSMAFNSAGIYNITLTVKDDRGGTGTAETTITVIRDVTPPSVDIRFPMPGAKLTGHVLVAAEVEDESSIRSVSVFVDENVFGKMHQNAFGTWEFHLNTASLPNGPHQLVVRVISNIGVIGEETIEFSSYNEDVLATITSPRDNDTLEGTVEVRLYVGDESRLNSAVLYVDDRPFGSRLMEGPWRFRFPTARLDNGFHTLSVKLITHDGQIEWTQELSIETLNEAEVSDMDVSIISPEEGEMLETCFPVEVIANTEENVKFVNLYLDDDILLETQEYSSYQTEFAFDVDLGDYGDGEHTLSIYLETETGCIGFADPVSITLKSGNKQMNGEFPDIYSFRADVRSGGAPLKVSFICLADDPDGCINEYKWDFGDGSRERISALRSTTHTYYNADTYQATCTVIDDNGLETKSDAVNITVESDIGPKVGNNLVMAYCATVNELTGQLHVPCVTAGLADAGQTYEMNFSVVSQTGSVYEMEDFSQVEVSNNNQCAAFDAFFDRLYIPCVNDGPLYWANCPLVPDENMRIKIQELELLTE